MNGEFISTKLDKVFDVTSIITVHYFEYPKGFIFLGEEHDFWELVYADRGDMYVFYNNEWHLLKAGHAIFHKPMQFHNVRTDEKSASNSVIISFECNSPCMSYFEDKMIFASQNERDLIAKIVGYAKQAFTTRLDDMFVKEMIKSGNSVAEHYISIYTEELLLSFYSKHSDKKIAPRSTMVNKNSLLDNAVDFMNENITKNLTINDISSHFHISDSELKRIFKEYTGMGVITYFRKLRIEKAKQFIREGNMNISQIAYELGYESIHHFSKQFKSIVKMSPREYSMSIKKWLDNV